MRAASAGNAGTLVDYRNEAKMLLAALAAKCTEWRDEERRKAA